MALGARVLWPMLAWTALACAKHDTTERAPAMSSSVTAAPAPSASTAVITTSAYAVIATARSPLRLFTLGGVSFVASGRLLYRADDHGLHQDVTLLAGFGGFVPDAARGGGEDFEIGGSWPDAAWLEAWSRDRATPDAIVQAAQYRWVKDRWRRAPLATGAELLLGLSPWRRGSALALLGDEDGVRLALANDKGFLDLEPEPTPWARAARAAAGDGGTDAAPPATNAAPALADGGALGCRSELHSLGRASTAFEHLPGLRAVLGLETGHVFIAGTSCADGDARWLVERIDPAGRKSQLDELARPRDAAARPRFRLFGRAADDVWVHVVEPGLLFHFDGKAWQAEALPIEAPLVDLDLSGEGTLWAVLGDGVYTRPHGGTWREVPLPRRDGQALHALRLSAAHDASVYIAARDSGEVLLGPLSPNTSVIELPDQKAAEKAAGDIVRYPASSVCESPYVLLLEHVKPGETKFSELAKLVKDFPGAELVTETSQKWTYLGARVPSMDAARRLAERARGVAEAKPELFCHEPRNPKKVLGSF